MKKISILVIITVLMASLTSCGGADKAGSGKPAPSPSSSSAGKSAEPAAANEEAVATDDVGEAAVAAAETPAPATTSEDKKQQDSVSSGKSQSSGNSSGSAAATQKKAATAKTTPKKAAEAPTETTKPAQAAKPPATETPAAKPAPIPSKPKTAYEKPYDTAKISAEMAAYGASIGMTWCAELDKATCSWEAPGITSSTLQGERLKTALQSSIRRIKKLQQDNGYNPGEFLFKVTFEPRGNGEYTIYFLMG
ncbi:MAG: hypothetical protein LBL36_06205 [Clostridiales Family XIII bacterium]|nr:hypothetical protein [Clostridiales Family XIII bacterium]